MSFSRAPLSPNAADRGRSHSATSGRSSTTFARAGPASRRRLRGVSHVVQRTVLRAGREGKSSRTGTVGQLVEGAQERASGTRPRCRCEAVVARPLVREPVRRRIGARKSPSRSSQWRCGRSPAPCSADGERSRFVRPPGDVARRAPPGGRDHVDDRVGRTSRAMSSPASAESAVVPVAHFVRELEKFGVLGPHRHCRAGGRFPAPPAASGVAFTAR